MTVHPSMALTGRSAPNAQRGWEPGLVTPKSPSSIHLLRNQERQKAFVLIVGAGKASHWASLWMFAVSGEVFAVELTAVESETGYRWNESNGKMRRLLPAATAATCGISSSRPADSFQQTTSLLADFSDSVGIDRQVSGANMEQETNEYECLLPFSTSADSLSLKVEKVLEAVCSEPSASGVREQRERIQKCIVDFIALSGRFSDIMAGDDKGHYWIEIEKTTPFQLYHRSQQVSMNGSFYDILFHNCQLYILQLMHDKYAVAFSKLPLAVGSVVAGPVMLTLEIIFMVVFAGLEQLEPWLAVLIGVLWVMAEMHCTYMYDGKDGFWIGAFATLLVLLYAQFDKAHPLVHTIPVLSLLWDTCMIKEAMLVNKVYESNWLMLLNAFWVLLALGVVCLLQLLRGWPVLDLVISGALLPVLLMARKASMYCFVEFCHADLLVDALKVLFRLEGP